MGDNTKVPKQQQYTQKAHSKENKEGSRIGTESSNKEHGNKEMQIDQEKVDPTNPRIKGPLIQIKDKSAS